MDALSSITFQPLASGVARSLVRSLNRPGVLRKTQGEITIDHRKEDWLVTAPALLGILLFCLLAPRLVNAAPPSRSKLSVHLLNSYSPGAQTVINAHPPVLKIVDTGLMQAVRDYKSSTPGGLTVLRIYTNRTLNRSTPAASAAEAYWNVVLAPPLNALSAVDRALIDYVEGPNENNSTPTWASTEDTVWYNDFWMKLAQLIADAGFKPCAYSIGVGDPPDFTIAASLNLIAPSLTYIKSRGGAWSYHNYTVNYTADPVTEIQHALRHRMFYDYFRTAHPHLVNLPIILTECGVTGTGSWSERGTAQDFQNWLTWLDSELRTESHVLGCTLFQIGDTGNWNRFDIEPISDWLATHLNSLPGSTEVPITQPFETLSWNSSYSAASGSDATFHLVSGGQTGKALEAWRSSAGYSTRVQVFPVPANTAGTVSVWIRCPSATAFSTHCAFKLGTYPAYDFDTVSGWTIIRSFSGSIPGNGGVWKKYNAPFNSGLNTKISVAFTHNANSGKGPVVQWDQLNISTSGPPSPADTFTQAITRSSDDAEEAASGGVSLTSTDIELVDDASNQTVGLRFPGLTVPHGAVITSATLQFTTDEIQSGPASLNIAAESSDDSSAFTATLRNLSSRPVTVGIPWQPSAWNITIPEPTPNLAAAVQEVIDRPGWSSGNALSFLITGTGRRTAVAFDKIINPAGPPASLTIAYSSATTTYSFIRWMLDYPALTDVTPSGDPDGDGFSNLLEYALRLHPGQSSPVPYTVTGGGGSLSFQYPRPSLAPDLTFAVESSPSLSGDWTTSGVTQQLLSDDGTTRIVRAMIPVSTSQIFVRLRVAFLP